MKMVLSLLVLGMSAMTVGLYKRLKTLKFVYNKIT